MIEVLGLISSLVIGASIFLEFMGDDGKTN
jgi:hypothetical protein